MTKIGEASHGMLGFDPNRAARVRSLRSSVVERQPDQALSPDVAPLWNELLPRIEQVTGHPVQPLRPSPPDPSMSDPIRSAQLLRTAATRLAAIARDRPDVPAAGQLAEVVTEHVSLMNELALRSRR